MTSDEWEALMILQIIGTTLNIHILSKSFPSTIGHKIIVGIMIVIYDFSVLCGILGTEKMISDSSVYSSKIFVQMFFGTLMFLAQNISII